MRLVDADKLKISYDGHFVGVAKNDLDNAPTVDARPIVHGHWTHLIYDEVTGEFACRCSCCHSASDGMYHFCKDCGAEMDEKCEVTGNEIN